MIVLGIETSCDETAAAVVRDTRTVVAETVASQVNVHAQFGGVVPEVASRRHVQDITAVIERTLNRADLRLRDLDAIAVTCGPGLLGSLLVGVSAAKGLALATGVPLVGVHHIAGHVAAAFVHHEVSPPCLALVVSGGHTELLTVDADFRFTRLGGTIDDAAGEAYDKVARILGFPYPGGPRVDQAAAVGDGGRFDFPRSFIETPDFNFSFSGLKTAVTNEVHKRTQRGEAVATVDVAASFQQAVIDVLVAKTVRAVRHTGLSNVVVAGGVAANQGLRQALHDAAAAHGFRATFPPLPLCTDNAVMIAAAGSLVYARGVQHTLGLNAKATLSLVDWQAGKVYL